MTIRRPLQTLELLILAALSDGPLHGYGLVQALESQTEGALKVRPGNLYRVLDRLCAAGLLIEAEPPPGPRRGADRTRGFAITEPGAARLETEAAMLLKALGRSATVRGRLQQSQESAS